MTKVIEIGGVRVREDFPTPATTAFMSMATSSGFGRPVIQCENCLRIHHTEDEPDRDIKSEIPEEVDQETFDWARTCDRLVNHVCEDAVSGAYFMGVHIVWGCPCNAAGELEERLRHNESDLLRWVSMRANQVLEDAKKYKAAMQDANKVRAGAKRRSMV
jgi:hypothetical protein